MKLVDRSGNAVETNAQVTSRKFGIKDEGFIIEILRSKLYSKPIQTLVQEYLSNGRDACREAGQETPLVVMVPTERAPIFKVRDYGVGLSPERVADVFVNYGDTTKRRDNTQTGGFGLGAKSAWAYTDNFTIVSYHNGVARHYIAHTGTERTGTLDLVTENPTSEPNGTEIQIAVAVKDIEAFTKAIYRATLFWKVRPELRGISWEQIPAYYQELKPIADIEGVTFFQPTALGDHIQGRGYYSPGLVLAVDGIPYEVPQAIVSQVPESETLAKLFIEGVACIIPIGNGEVEIAPNRETLIDSDFTRTGLQAIAKRAYGTITNHINSRFTNAQSVAEFIEAYRTIRQFHKLARTVYFTDSDGDSFEIDQNGKLASSLLNGMSVARYSLRESYRSNALRLQAEALSKPEQGIQLGDRDLLFEDEITSDVKRTDRLKTELSFLNSGDTHRKKEKEILLLSCPNPADANFLRLATKLDARPISNLETSRKKKAQARKSMEGRVCIHFYVDSYTQKLKSQEIEISNADQALDRPVIYVVKSKQDETYKQQVKDHHSLDRELKGSGYNLCFIAETHAKKVKDHPSFVSVTDFMANPSQYLDAEHFEAKLRQFQRVYLANVVEETREYLSHKDFKATVDQIDDLELKEGLQLAGSVFECPDERLPSEGKFISAMLATQPRLKRAQELASILAVKLQKTYPILSRGRSYGYGDDNPEFARELLWYVNSKWQFFEAAKACATVVHESSQEIAAS